MSKVHGLAGLRVGSLMGPPDCIELIDRVRNPFNVNNLAQRAAIVALDDDEYLEQVQKVNREGRNYFYQQFEALGLKFWRSQANFVLVEPRSDGQQLFAKLLERGVIVRPMPLRADKTFLRISVGDMEENKACVAALTDLKDHL
jgi:histidinol-phosphate aminotransferase